MDGPTNKLPTNQSGRITQINVRPSDLSLFLVANINSINPPGRQSVIIQYAGGWWLGVIPAIRLNHLLPIKLWVELLPRKVGLNIC